MRLYGVRIGSTIFNLEAKDFHELEEKLYLMCPYGIFELINWTKI